MMSMLLLKIVVIGLNALPVDVNLLLLLMKSMLKFVKKFSNKKEKSLMPRNRGKVIR